eukprot:5037347-Pleurochrysis_carterae.AAC.1
MELKVANFKRGPGRSTDLFLLALCGCIADLLPFALLPADADRRQAALPLGGKPRPKKRTHAHADTRARARARTHKEGKMGALKSAHAPWQACVRACVRECVRVLTSVVT